MTNYKGQRTKKDNGGMIEGNLFCIDIGDNFILKPFTADSDASDTDKRK